jgi:hypothetical protein
VNSLGKCDRIAGTTEQFMFYPLALLSMLKHLLDKFIIEALYALWKIHILYMLSSIDNHKMKTFP